MSEQFKKEFHNLGEVFEPLETFVCHLCGFGEIKRLTYWKVNDMRFISFNRRYKRVRPLKKNL